MEHARDQILLQLEAKIQIEEYTAEILQQDIQYRHYLNTSDRIVLQDKLIRRQCYDETGQVKYHQILLPKHLLKELLLALHGTAHKHPGISKMLQETRQKYHCPEIAKHVKKVLQNKVITRQCYDETGRVKYHQILLPKHLLKELLLALHDTAHKHPGISKMLQETRQKYHYPEIAKHVTKWVASYQENIGKYQQQETHEATNSVLDEKGVLACPGHKGGRSSIYSPPNELRP